MGHPVCQICVDSSSSCVRLFVIDDVRQLCDR